MADAVKQAERDAMMRHPLVEAAFAAFPDAQLIEDSPDAQAAQGGRKWSR